MRRSDCECDRRKTLERVPSEVLIKRRVCDLRAGIGKEQRMAVWHRPRDLCDTDIAARATPVLDNELPAKLLNIALSQESRGEVGRAAGCPRNDDCHRPRRVGLRPSDISYRRQRCNARYQMQKISTVGKFHRNSSRACWIDFLITVA